MPGAGMSSSGRNDAPKTAGISPNGNASNEEQYDSALKLGAYVELDESIKNEMHGTINFPNGELKDIVQAISKMANKNFILDRKIENRRITIINPTPVTKQEAYNAFLSALYMNDLTIVPMGRFLKIIEAKNAIQSNTRVFMGDYAPASEEVVTVLYPLKNLNADDIQRFVTDLVPRNGRIAAYPNTNTLVMTDTGLNLRRVIAILKSIDIPGHQDQLESIRVRHADAKGLAKLIDEILSAQSGANRPGIASRSGPQRTRGGGLISKIVPDDRTNSLVVLANGRGIEELKQLINKLDSADSAGGGNIHIYSCKNAVADELATTINGLVSSTTKPGSSGGGGGGYTPPPGMSPIGGAGNSTGGGGVRFEGNVKVTADKATNSLVVVASGSDFAALKVILDRLDKARRQVFVEATIMELSITNADTFNISTNIAGPSAARLGGFIPDGADITALATSPTALTGIVAGISSGATYQYFDPVAKANYSLKTVTALIRALATSKQGQILHQPQILTSDNQEAEIKIVNKVPVVSTTVTQGATTSSSESISKEDVKIGLKITPQIGEDNDLVKLKVDQSVDDFVPFTTPGHSIVPNVTQRSATTTVVVRDSDTAVIGGLQRSSVSDEKNKFPLLGDIPVLGWLFKGSTSQTIRTNLVLFLTPHIINEYSDLMRITGTSLEQRKKLAKTLYDPKDENADYAKQLEAKNKADLQKPTPKGWGFRPMPVEKELNVEAPAEVSEPAPKTASPEIPASAPKTDEPLTPPAAR